ncbi:hypothetical protein P148_SR1C00001G0964 [candidate division SR1 bacterium RAAC1_SR1_1]|nr:hypothetical protein P148_SR1C00001G0964 [candidate division SR1 bacterium RAAC1_SR1_1]
MKKISLEKIKKKIESGFFGFWVQKWRFTFVLVALIIVVGIFSVYEIPKETSPDIDFGIISVGTVYQGVNPQDIDNLITEKIEQEIKDIQGIKKITSTSVVGFSSIILELENDANTNDVIVDIKDSVDKADLPSDAEEPVVTEISSDNELMFNVLLYGEKDIYSQLYLVEKARRIKSNLAGKGSITTIDVGGYAGMESVDGIGGNSQTYDVYVLVNKDKLEALGMNFLQLGQILQQWNKNQPLGSHVIDQFSYDFRIQGSFDTLEQLKNIPITTREGFIYLKDIAKIEKRLNDDNFYRLGAYQITGQNYVALKFNKKSGANIFDASTSAKELLEDELNKYDYDGLSVLYTSDMSELISKDYDGLINNFLQSIVLVFLSLLVLVGIRESLIAATTFPLALLVTFIVLDQMGMTLNFLTNFSFLITFSIAVDTTIVIIEGANEKIKLGYNPKNAILLTVKEYKGPLITATITNVVVFLPMLMLPGIMGKFLAYIPITIFSTLLAALFIGLTINSALYFKIAKKKNYFENDEEQIQYMNKEDLALLEDDRKDKEQKDHQSLSFRENMLNKINDWYFEKITWVTENVKRRFWAVMIPLIGLVVSFVFLAPLIGFKLFPDNDNGYMTMSIVGKKGLTNKEMEKQLYFTNKAGQTLDDILANTPEIKVYSYNVMGNSVSINLEFLDPIERKKDGMRNVFVLEKYFDKELNFLRSYGLRINIAALKDGPPGTKEVGIKLIADSNKKMQNLIEISRDFENYLRDIPGVKNVGNSSQETPGQFVYTLDAAKLSMLGLTPGSLYLDLYALTNGRNAGTLKGQLDNHNIKLKYDGFDKGMTPSDLDQININTQAGQINFGDISTYSFDNAISAVSREDTKISIVIDANLELGYTSNQIQSQLDTYASSYIFPDGITYKQSGENQENADLINAMLMAFLIAIFAIFGILVFQLNSYLQPAIIMYSIAVGLLGANIGLFVTGNAYSIMFGIGFISLTGIIVNDSILCLYKINENIRIGMEPLKAIRYAGRSRLQPIIVNVLAATLGLASVINDDFWKTLAITIIFGLLFGSFSNLFALPSLFYDKQKIVLLVKRALIPIFNFIKRPIVVFIGLILFSGFFELGFLGSVWFAVFVVLLLIIYAIWYFKAQYMQWINNGATQNHDALNMKIVDLHGKNLSKKHISKRMFWFLLLLIGPLVLTGLLSILIGGYAAMFGLFIYLGLGVYNLYLFWTGENGQLLHDKLAETKIIYVLSDKN